MEELRRIITNWKEEADEDAVSTSRGVGIDVHNADAKAKSVVLQSVLNQIDRLAKD